MTDTKLLLEVVAKTDTGMVRPANEDNFVVTDDCKKEEWLLPKGEYTNSEGGTIMVIADGMGGLNAGEVASKIVVEKMHTYLSKAETVKEKRALLVNAIVNAHEEIIKHSYEFPETEGMGSTVVAAWVEGNEAHIAWVGDSRCYLVRGKKIIQLSKDHSYVQSLVDDGKITREQAFHHPESNIITQSLGDITRKPKPGYQRIALANNDMLLLCSDGLSGMIQDEQINEIINNNDNITMAVDALIEKANAEGGVDNISVVLVKVFDGAVGTSTIADGIAINEKKKPLKKRILFFGIVAIVLFAAILLVSKALSPKEGAIIIKPVGDSTSIAGKDSSEHNKNETTTHPHKDSNQANGTKITEAIHKDKISDAKDSAQKKPGGIKLKLLKDNKPEAKGLDKLTKIKDDKDSTIKKAPGSINKPGIIKPVDTSQTKPIDP